MYNKKINAKIQHLFIALVLAFTTIFIYSKDAFAAANLQVHFIDVGQGDAMLINLPNGENMVVDAGENNQGTTVVNYIKGRSVTKIDYVVGTHAHSDHIGGLDDVIKSFNIGKVYLPAKSSTTQTYLDVLSAVQNKGLTVTTARAGVSLVNTTVDGKALKVYMVGPRKDNYTNVNDSSAVIKIIYGTTSFLLTGDAETLAETDMVNAGEDLSASILKVGHHGSNTSTSDAFLNKVNPKAAIISVGTGNTYNHPTQVVIDKLKAKSASIYRTDTNGTIIITTSGSGWLVNKTAWWRP